MIAPYTTQTPTSTELWELNFSFAKGWNWVACRTCEPDTAEAWLAQYQADEPGKVFRLSKRKPKLPTPAELPHTAPYKRAWSAVL